MQRLTIANVRVFIVVETFKQEQVFLKEKVTANERQTDAGFFPIAGKPLLLKVNGLITAVRVELCSPHLVHALVLGSTEGHWCSESKVQVLETFESLNELFGIEIRPIALQRGDQDVCGHITFEGHVVWRLAREVFGHRSFVIEDQR
jgi:hypothetical protein